MNRSVAETRARVEKSLKRRRWAELRFKTYGLCAVLLGLSFVVLLFGSLIAQGWSAFRQAYVVIEVHYDPAVLNPEGTATADDLAVADYASLVRAALKARFPDVEGRAATKQLAAMVSNSAAQTMQKRLAENPQRMGQRETLRVLASDKVDQLLKGRIDRSVPEADRAVSDLQLGWIDALVKDGSLSLGFNKGFFTQGDSREPEQAGVWGAVVGTLYTLAMTLLLSFPIAVAAAIYLEEFARRNRWTDLIEVNINNLAAVPSIVFGLLGLAVFLNIFGMPRSAPLVGGLVLTLLTLPTIIIASRAALKAVPPSIREAALGMGASKVQMVTHHVLPLAMPGILTGTIIGMARALGETAPLLMIGMVAFIVDVPKGLTDPATVLPVQIFLWADSPERAFIERTSAAILVLLLFLVVMNATAVILRNRFERRW
jgi:phosphate transport system permease protein